jgi:predicted  nucleic acid-binding Zn-ribbon protein
MLPDVQNLMELQQADREILRLKEEIAALPKRVAVIEQKLAGTKAVLENAKTGVKADEAARRKYETAIQDLQQKISKYRDQSLEVKTNDQYKALMHEIQFAEQDIRANEDKILELMVNAEEREKSVKAAEIELKAEMAEIEKEKNDARQRTAEDEKQLADWHGRRDKARAGVNPDLLRHYDRVSKFRGTGLAEVRDQKCVGCQVVLRPQTFNEVRIGQMVICESCQRILYFDPASETVEQANAATRRRRPRPKADADQAWYYRAEYADHGEVFVVFININVEGSSSRRVYDAHSGRKLGETETLVGDYHTAFASDLAHAVRLNGAWPAPEIEEWGTEMPTRALDSLFADLLAARAETAKGHVHANPAEAITSEHPAAS